LYAALAAARQGWEVDLFERRRVGEGIVCGECIFDALGVLERPSGGVLRDVTVIVLQAFQAYRFPAGRYRRLWMMDRAAWQRDLARQAIQGGVVLREGQRVAPRDIPRLCERYDGVIDGSGAPSVASRAFGFARSYLEGCLLAYQVVLEGDFSSLSPAIKAAFLPDLPHEVMPGYSWVFPRDEATANVGVGCFRPGNGRFPVDLKGLLREVLRREGLAGAPVLRRGGGLIPGRVLPRLAYGNLLLVGDAAGLTSPLHGGGMDMACLSGALAVQALARGLSGTEGYRARLLDCIREKEAMEAVMIRKLRTLDFAGLDRLLKAAAVPDPLLRARAALEHGDLLLASWRWLRRRQEGLPPLSGG
jgi:digeranylgeranylglycerophospholipid reductase